MKYRRFLVCEKLEIIRLAKSTSINNAAKTCKVDRKVIRQWILNEASLAKSPYKLRRSRAPLPIDKRQVKNPELEGHLTEWIREKRQQGAIVDGCSIKREANRIAYECDISDFSPNNGWFHRFLSRSNLSLRRITTSGRDLPNDANSIINEFIRTCKQQIGSITNLSNIINMDETSVYLDSPSSYTYAEIGSRRVKAATTGNEKTRLSIAFAATANGQKLKPIVIVPRVNAMSNYIAPDNVIVVYSKAGTFNDKMIKDGFIQKVLYPFMLAHGLANTTLLMDSAPCHLTSLVTDSLKDLNVNTIQIPPRMTNLLQPADVSWMRPLKKSFHQKWQHWFLNAEKTKTRFDNIRSPGYAQVITWVSEIWATLNPNVIRASFDLCGITQYKHDHLHSQLQAF